MSTCELFLQAVCLGLMTWFWLAYLTWEATHYKRKDDEGLRWWEREL
jgi:hypothetical protein